MNAVQQKRLIGVLVALAAASLLADAANAQKVGTAAAVNPAAQARGAGGSRTIVLGQSITHRERIQTTSAGSVQLLFLDKTSMTIGPNSDLAIDEYVYDPGSNTGRLAATLTKGVMRFVGGQISHAGNAQITTPNAVVGIRGGVGIFSTRSVYIGYGEGNVRSGSSIVTLGAGDFTQTPGGGAPPTNPGPPPSGFLQTVLAALQSRPGQGGGARATSGQVNNARTAATGSSTGTLATNVQGAVNSVPPTTQTLAALTQTVQTSIGQTQVEHGIEDQGRYRIGFTGGLVFSRNNYGPFGPIISALGVAFLQSDRQSVIEQAIFGVTRGGTVSTGYYNPYAGPSDEFQSGGYSFGPNRHTVNIDDLALGATVLAPTTTPGGYQGAVINNEVVSQFAGGVVEFRPGTTLTQAASQAVGVAFCQCDYTRWGLWAADTTRSGQIPAGGNVRDTAEMFWVAGKPPLNASDIPITGTATYTGHAIANIQNGGSSYVSAAPFRNDVNFGTRTGTIQIPNLDGATYSGQVMHGSGSPVFGGIISAPSASRYMELVGSFYQGRSGPVGEMGGALRIYGPSNYGGAGIFAASKQ